MKNPSPTSVKFQFDPRQEILQHHICNRRIHLQLQKAISSARTRPTPKRARPVQIRLTTSPHPIVPARFGSPILSIQTGRSVIPLLPRDVRSGPLLLPGKSRPKVRRHELVRLRRRHGERGLPVPLQRRGRGGEQPRASPGSTERAEGDGVRVRFGPVLGGERRRGRQRSRRRDDGNGFGRGRRRGRGCGSGQDEHAAVGEVGLVGAAGEGIMRGGCGGVGGGRGGPGRVVLGRG